MHGTPSRSSSAASCPARYGSNTHSTIVCFSAVDAATADPLVFVDRDEQRRVREVLVAGLDGNGEVGSLRFGPVELAPDERFVLVGFGVGAHELVGNLEDRWSADSRPRPVACGPVDTRTQA
jgi:hypothetical protein